MPPRSKVTKLPAAVKAWLDAALVEGGFSGYEVLSAELQARGYSIGKSALHNYGQDFEKRLQTLKLVTQQARAVVAASPDDDGAVNDALMRLTQEKLFQLLVDAQIDPEMGCDLPKVARAVAELGKASVSQKRWQAEARKAALAEAAEAAGTAAKNQGLTDEAVEAIRSRILGVAA